MEEDEKFTYRPTKEQLAAIPEMPTTSPMPMYLVDRAVPVGVNETTFKRVCNTAEILYRTNRRLPTMAEMQKNLPMQQRHLTKIMSSREFAQHMANRGIRWTGNSVLLNEITPEQGMVISIVTDPSNKKPFDQKLRSAGITYQTWRNWLAQPAFASKVGILAESVLGDNLAIFHTALARKAGEGDVAALRLAHELTGRHDPAKQQMVDVMKIVALVLEAITRHVRDPLILGEVTKDIDYVIANGNLPALSEMPNNYDGADIITGAQVDEQNKWNLDSSGRPIDHRTDNLPNSALPVNFFDFEGDDTYKEGGK